VRRLLLVVVVASCTREGAKPAAPPAAAPAPAPAAAVKPAPVDHRRSLVTVLCDGAEGPGFFSAPNRVVARARFVCDAPRVRLFDGRTLLGTVRARQKALDLAELEVAGGEGEPLAFADSLAVAETDDVSVAGGVTGTVRSTPRTRLGVPHLEAAFDRLPPPGSVVVDTRGRAIGLTADATLVLPIEAVGPSAAWAKWVERSRPAVADEVARLRRALDRPALVTALVDPSGVLYAVLLARVPASEVKLEGCGAVRPAWEPFRMNAWFDAWTRDLFQFIDAHDLDIGLSMSMVAVPCRGAAELRLEGADPALGQAMVGKTEQVMAATAAGAPAVPKQGPAAAAP
jgi:hypothetical protein